MCLCMYIHTQRGTLAYIFIYVDAPVKKTEEEQLSSTFTASTICASENSCVMMTKVPSATLKYLADPNYCKC
jgi:hypothetical protein